MERVIKVGDSQYGNQLGSILLPYQQAVSELKVKLRGIRKQFENQSERPPIEFVTGRVKPIASIKEKMSRRHVAEERLEQDMQDIAGLRIMSICRRYLSSS